MRALKPKVLICLSVCLLGSFFGEKRLLAREPWQNDLFSGGKVSSVSPKEGEVLPPGKFHYFFATNPINLRKEMKPAPKRLRQTAFVTVRSEKGDIDSAGPHTPEAGITPGAHDFSQKGGGLFPAALPSGKYQLIVTVLAQVDDEKPHLIDIHIVNFRVAEQGTVEKN